MLADIDPSQFSAIITAYTFIVVIVGGRGSHRGLSIGAVVIRFLIYRPQGFVAEYRLKSASPIGPGPATGSNGPAR